MSDYQAPVREMMFVLRELAGIDAVATLPAYTDATADVVEAVLGEAAQLAADVIAPTNAIGDRAGTRIQNGGVVVPPEFIDVYRQFTAGGWAGLSLDAGMGGQGLPYAVGVAAEEIWQAANLAWALCPLLTQAAARTIESHGSATLRRTYVQRMASGEWTGTMNLTEPQAGSDLAAVRTQAVREGDHYRVSGQKIFITWGDHDMADNIVHLVLARLPDAEAGTRGTSLFLVPKFLVNPDGSIGARNGVAPVSVEHKLGIHGSPTCVMAFDNAIGYLVGEEGRGLACMFTMMNHARLGVGLEGIAISERSYQKARAYARDRVQGRTADGRSRAIIGHPDVRRMVVTMKSQIEAMRAAAYCVAADLDFAHHAPDPAARARHQARVDLLIPVIKGWCTETAQQLTSIGLQVHGGMGYVEETGVAQYYRDARITTIYEGTTGIQAGDFVGRKILRDGGTALQALIADMRATVRELKAGGERLAVIAAGLERGVAALAASAAWLAGNWQRHPAIPGAASYHLLMLTGVLLGAWQHGRSALAAVRLLGAGGGDRAFLEARLATAAFYATQILPQAEASRQAIVAGSDDLLALPENQL
ncbi:MAG: acyl-CoA dehydrogenase [Gammaproteobacteria bacterium]|nr:acyl-CoA dehydrogenase [Gammaproteobacteria bacterium]